MSNLLYKLILNAIILYIIVIILFYIFLEIKVLDIVNIVLSYGVINYEGSLRKKWNVIILVFSIEKVLS
jgi:hypothetical protein